MTAEKINDLIFKELLKRGYSLEGKTRVWNIADSKLWYLTPKQAQAYLDLLDTESYQSEFGPKELTLIRKHIDELLKKVGKGPLNIVDLGCGDGRKAAIFIQKLKNQEKVRYCPIDISGYMVERAIESMSKLNVEEIVEPKWNISDFENLENIMPLLSRGIYKKNLFMLLGNTLGNFDFHELLYQIRSSMKSGDFLVIGNGLDNGMVEEDVINFLKTNEKNNDFLIQIPLQLGLKRSDISLDIKFVNSRIEFSYVLKEDKEIKFQGKKVSFERGDQIIVAISYHYNKEDFTSFLNLYFDEVVVKTSEDGSYAIALCKK